MLGIGDTWVRRPNINAESCSSFILTTVLSLSMPICSLNQSLESIEIDKKKMSLPPLFIFLISQSIRKYIFLFNCAVLIYLECKDQYWYWDCEANCLLECECVREWMLRTLSIALAWHKYKLMRYVHFRRSSYEFLPAYSIHLHLLIFRLLCIYADGELYRCVCELWGYANSSRYGKHTWALKSHLPSAHCSAFHLDHFQLSRECGRIYITVWWHWCCSISATTFKHFCWLISPRIFDQFVRVSFASLPAFCTSQQYGPDPSSSTGDDSLSSQDIVHIVHIVYECSQEQHQIKWIPVEFSNLPQRFDTAVCK